MSWVAGVSAVTLFADDLDAAKRFYREVFELPVYYEDQSSAVFRFGDVLINLLVSSEAADLVGAEAVGSARAGTRAQFTIEVDDVDSRAEVLRERGAEILTGPIDRPWGIRTLAFRDPAGHVWEIAGPLLGRPAHDDVPDERAPDQAE
jgi:catechol 2,3-dioxygenase-like lactoylglutathione lyase family enzyme